MEKTLETVERYILFAVVFLLPLLVLPIFPNAFITPKLTLLTFGIGLLLLSKAVRTIIRGSIGFKLSNFDLPVAMIAGVYLVSAILRTPNAMEAFFLPGTASFVLSGALLYFLINQLKEVEKKSLGLVILVSGIVFSAVTLVAATGLLSSTSLPDFIKNNTFTLLGGSLPAAIFLLTLIPLGVGLLVSEKERVKKIILSASLVFVIFGLAISIYNSLRGPLSPSTNQPIQQVKARLPDFRTSWFVAIDSVKESPLLGVGPGNYLSAFNRFRPLAYNASELWAVRFTTGSNYYLTALAETGLLGLAGIALLIWTVIKLLRKEFKKTPSISAQQPGDSILLVAQEKTILLISVSILLLLIGAFPATATLSVFVFILLALAAKTHKVQAMLSGQALPTSETLSSSNSVSKLPAIVVALPVIIAVVLLFVNARRIIAAEITYKNALDALVQNEATLTFNSMREAINLNPRVDRYHASYAQVNLALANSIASKDPEEITDEDRASIAQLIQQAIAEGKATVALNPQRAGNWEVLASIYRSIIPFAQGADQFAIQTYKQAVALDPVNPSLRINLGGVFYSLQNYNDAIRAFELAVLAKPDLANAHFNLSAALRENGEIEAAVEEMKLVLALVDRGTRDYELSKQELEKLNEMLPLPERPEEEETIEATPETLTTPEAVEEAPIEPIELPEEAAPPETPEGETETELSPTPTPTPTPTLP